MPVITVPRPLVKRVLYNNADFTDNHFEDLLFDYSLELDRVTEEGDFIVEIHANRPDLLSPNLLLLNLRCFTCQPSALHDFVEPKINESFEIQVDRASVVERPFIRGAVLYNCKLTLETLKTFLEFQDKLALSLGKQRELLAIGTHDTSAFSFPLVYKLETTDELVFRSLFEEEEEESNASTLFAKYQTTSSVYARFVDLLPAGHAFSLRDKNGSVLCVPPVINSFLTRARPESLNLFVDVTGTDLPKVEAALRLVCAAATSSFCKTTERVALKDGAPVNGSYKAVLESRKAWQISKSFVSAKLGVSLEKYRLQESVACFVTGEHFPTFASLFQRTGHSVVSEDGETATVYPHATRTDVLHLYDLVEDAAVAFGVNFMPTVLPTTQTFGRQIGVQKLKEALRVFCAAQGWNETNSFVLGNGEKFVAVNSLIADSELVRVSNPNSTSFDTVRNFLFPSVFATAVANVQRLGLPLKVFEVADCVELQEGCVQQKNKLALLCLSKKSDVFEEVHGALDGLSSVWAKKYLLKPNESKLFFKNRGVDIYFNNTPVGNLGILSKQFMQIFGLNKPEFFVGVLEIDTSKLIS